MMAWDREGSKCQPLSLWSDQIFGAIYTPESYWFRLKLLSKWEYVLAQVFSPFLLCYLTSFLQRALPQVIMWIKFCISTQFIDNSSLPFLLVQESLSGEHAKFFNPLETVTTTSTLHFHCTGLEFRSWWLTTHFHTFLCFSLELCLF